VTKQLIDREDERRQEKMILNIRKTLGNQLEDSEQNLSSLRSQL